MRHPERLVDGQPFRQWKTWTIPGTGLTMSGYSRAADRTFLHVPGLRLGLDGGQCEGRQPDTVLLTHTHDDHAKDLAFLARPDADVYLPAASLPYAEDHLRAAGRLNHGAAYDPALAGGHRLHGVSGGDEFRFGRQEGHHVRVVDCAHKVPCVGYAVSEIGKALLPRYRELREELGSGFGREMARLRAEGVEFEEETSRPLFAFIGDTHPVVFEREPWLLDFPVVITECTFLHDTERDRADRDGHTVWSALRPHVEAHPETLFVLIHFSLRHSDREIVEFFGAHGMPENVVPWADAKPLLPELHQPG